MMDSFNADFSRHTVLVLGDVMLDTWIYGHVERISPEAPVPVLRTDRRREMLGGAGNVARNLIALGAHTLLIGVIGDDPLGRQLCDLTDEMNRTHSSMRRKLLVSQRATTIQKTRYIAAGQHILRVDDEIVRPVDQDIAKKLIAEFAGALDEADSVVLSDYAKGTLTVTVIDGVIAAARAAGKSVIADPKSRDFSRYNGATVLTPNRSEVLAATGIDCTTDEDAAKAGRFALAQADVAAIVITRGAEGVTVVPRDGDVTHIGARARSVFDVSGAGDTFIATLAASLAGGATLVDAAGIANVAAGLVVEKAGTATITAAELSQAVHDAHHGADSAKVLTLDAVLEHVERWRINGLRVGFTNGCFDLLHPGHVSLLAKARGACDRLIVALNSDASVRRIKGADRPIQNEIARAIVMASLSSVDLVVLFDDDTPIALIEAIRPDILVKGADYAEDEVVGAPLVRSYGGRVCLVPVEQGHSTSAMVSRIATQRDGPQDR